MYGVSSTRGSLSIFAEQERKYRKNGVMQEVCCGRYAVCLLCPRELRYFDHRGNACVLEVQSTVYQSFL